MDRAALWSDTAPAGDRAALDPGIPDDLDRTTDVLVVGGGYLGVATAAFCRRADLGSVVLVEQARLAAGASGGGAGILGPEAHVWDDASSLVALGRLSLGLTRELDEEWDGALGLRPLDSLLFGRRIADAPIPFAVPVEQLDEGEARVAEPAIAEGLGGAVFVPDQARTHPIRFVTEMAHRGGQVATGVGVERIEFVGERIARLHTTAGVLSPGAVVFCTGVPPPAAVSVPHTFVKGHLVVTEPVDIRLATQVVHPRGGALQLEDGRLLAGGTLDTGDDAPEVRDDVVTAIRSSIGRVVPAATDVKVSHAWCCFRPAAPDLLPIVDRVPGASNAWFTSGHYRTGLLMAAATGRALAEWIRTGAPPAEVAPFRLDRPTIGG